jgi:protoheme IX farnesyltransferase
MRELSYGLTVASKYTLLLKHIWITTKPALTRLVVLTTLCGAAVAPQALNTLQWVGVFLGTYFIVMAANIFNGVLEKDVDIYMSRTKSRPLATGELSPDSALIAGFVLSVLALLILAAFTNFLTALLGFLGFFSYVFIYTPLKRISMGALFVGAIPGAIPPMMGWTSATNNLDLGAWILFGILFFWQLPHFIAIALNRQNEYVKAGLKTLPEQVGAQNAFVHMAAYSAALFVVSLLPYYWGLAGEFYLWVTLPLSFFFFSFCVAGLLKTSTVKWGRLIFFGSLVYLPFILGGWVLDLFLSK